MPDDKGGAAICEIGWCDLNVVLADPTTGLVQTSIVAGGFHFCDPGHPIPPVARAVHHISDADVGGQMTPAQGLTSLMEGGPDYFCAHNAPFERAFFYSGSTPWLCTYRIAVRLWPDAPAHSNQVLRYWLGLELDDPDKAMPPHRAGPDAYVTAHILARMLENGAGIEDMVRWSSGPPLLPRINFGKHKGARWEDVPTDYLDWIINKSDLDADTKANARHRLKQRGAA